MYIPLGINTIPPFTAALSIAAWIKRASSSSYLPLPRAPKSLTLNTVWLCPAASAVSGFKPPIAPPTAIATPATPNDCSKLRRLSFFCSVALLSF
ncbi:hypothetical protein D3C73_1020440 [compost metagenome]